MATETNRGGSLIESGMLLVPRANVAELLLFVDPPPITIGGTTHRFVNPDAARLLYELSAAVRRMIDASATDENIARAASAPLPRLTPPQAERLAAGLDDRDGGHDQLVAFVYSLAGMTPPTEQQVPGVRMTVTIPGQAEPIAEWQRDMKGNLLEETTAAVEKAGDAVRAIERDFPGAFGSGPSIETSEDDATP